MIYRLVKHKISAKQLFSFALVNIIGLSIVFLGFQLYKDIKPIIVGDDTIANGEYIVLTKDINTLGSLFGSSNFSDKEINNIKKQDFIDKIGVFETSLFSVRAGINMPTLPINLATDLFFEAIPDDFIDVQSDKWLYNPNTEEIPIILPKSYLDLYNFGFAASRKLPQLTENSINNIKLNITISSKSHFAQTYTGKIVGFSKRINSILVPLDFLQDANTEFAQQKSKPTRLIIKVNNPNDKNLVTFIKDNNYQVDGNQLDGSRNSNLLYIATAIVLIIGLLICFLSCYILILSIYLLLEKNLTILENLSLLGYSRKQIAKPYQLLIIILNAITFILSILLVYGLRLMYIPVLSTVSTDNISPGLGIATLALALFSYIILCFISIRMVKIRIKKATKFIK